MNKIRHSGRKVSFQVYKQLFPETDDKFWDEIAWTRLLKGRYILYSTFIVYYNNPIFFFFFYKFPNIITEAKATE